jgi:CheY-like chemotaxis protein
MMTTILLVDDNELQRKLIRKHLEHAGYEVAAAANGHEAIELARASTPDLIVSDVVMGGLDGYGLCSALRGDAKLDHVPIVLFTTHDLDSQARIRARSVGAFELIERSPDFARELDWIEAAIHSIAVSLDDLLDGMTGVLQHMLGSEIRIQRNQQPNLGTIQVPVRQLEEVLVHLMANAHDAMRAGGTLVIATSNDHVSPIDSISSSVPPGHYIVLEVSDSGDGSGLGLATASSLVREVGGHVVVHSQLEVGTVFRAFFPRFDAAQRKLAGH